MNDVKLKDINGNDVEYNGVRVFIRDISNNFKEFFGSGSIKDVYELPTENIDTNLIYRKPVFVGWISVSGEYVFPYTIECIYVKTRPTENILAMPEYIYYVEDEHSVLGYLDSEWVNYSENDNYNGEITDISQAVSDGMYAILGSSYHKYIDNVWHDYIEPFNLKIIKPIGDQDVTKYKTARVEITLNNEAEMNSALENAEVGMVFKYSKYADESDIYENGAYYVVEEGE